MPPVTMELVTASLSQGPLEIREGHQLCDCAHVQHEVLGLVVKVTVGGVLVFLRPYPHVLHESQEGKLSPLITMGYVPQVLILVESHSAGLETGRVP